MIHPENLTDRSGGPPRDPHGDTFVKQDGAWLFAERNLYVDWTETRPSRP